MLPFKELNWKMPLNEKIFNNTEKSNRFRRRTYFKTLGNLKNGLKNCYLQNKSYQKC